jgi:hypothetical protein
MGFGSSGLLAGAMSIVRRVLRALQAAGSATIFAVAARLLLDAAQETTVAETHDPRYPIGRMPEPETVTKPERTKAVEALAQMPALLREALDGLSEAQIDTHYREGGWTVRQVVHHMGDSHMTAFHRMRRALTEQNPLVPGYDEKAFAALADSAAPIEWSVDLLTAVHARMVMMLQSLDEAQWARTYNHTERGESTVAQAVVLYEWHSKHHVAHITQLRAAKGW